MNPQPDWTPAQWFNEAVRCYIEGHQACPWCDGSHRVFKSERAGRLDFYCYCCDFYVGYEEQTDCYHVVPGRQDAAAERHRVAGCF
ncbi:MAG TPA: hypothetical protein VNK04_04685 [Gemmataceae bacterium]|jgi:hypothetical protein|nr:hypothetical protein [Gemmataceae bacterium]